MILVDTSVWIDHLHAPVDRLVEALHLEDVLTHPFVIGELACGQLRSRRELLGLFGALPSATVATHQEALQFIETYKLAGKGLGYIDVHLLASAILTERAQLWTNDRQLRALAEKLGLAG